MEIEEISFDDVLPPKDLPVAKKNGSVCNSCRLSSTTESSSSNLSNQCEVDMPYRKCKSRFRLKDYFLMPEYNILPRTHASESFTCKICFQTKRTFISFRNHKCIKQNCEKLFSSDVTCETSISQESCNKHVAIDTEEKTPISEFVHEQFLEDKVDNHVCIATGNNVFPCKALHTDLAESQALCKLTSNNSHNEEVSVSCSVCQKTFANEDILLKHSIVHSMFSCVVCGKTYRKKAWLNQHLLKHQKRRRSGCIFYNPKKK